MVQQIEKRPIKLPTPLIQLGTVENVIDDQGVKYKWTVRDQCGLLCPTSGTSIFCLIAEPKQATREKFENAVNGNTEKVSKGMDLYEKWHEFDPESGSLVTPPRGFLFCVGRAASITYRSDKWVGKTRRYIHTFKIKPKVWVNKKIDPTLLVLTGGKIRTTKDGITG